MTEKNRASSPIAFHRDAGVAAPICPYCDYSLNGLPNAAICPECGKAPGAQQVVIEGAVSSGTNLTVLPFAWPIIMFGSSPARHLIVSLLPTGPAWLIAILWIALMLGSLIGLHLLLNRLPLTPVIRLRVHLSTNAYTIKTRFRRRHQRWGFKNVIRLSTVADGVCALQIDGFPGMVALQFPASEGELIELKNQLDQLMAVPPTSPKDHRPRIALTSSVSPAALPSTGRA